ncbi:hypothetical protein DFA_04586 [Cavenderia fasciculata]|uniref:KATNIP domain-containing protein n=1 Tax=Cavenderia fasciculata TaxID=261658 RepID=F4PPZ6_CACFS|nr:uncharacterized protein DFA_04586 [Cavenderia fasciculata]EGG22459.1 hypothetical protein DFA_04586 [Cavenderia fasciculata]|eukprot:XP_004360310.1 hypothetical protein DFA_04586 [Cavenderia fasciculata]
MLNSRRSRRVDSLGKSSTPPVLSLNQQQQQQNNNNILQEQQHVTFDTSYIDNNVNRSTINNNNNNNSSSSKTPSPTFSPSSSSSSSNSILSDQILMGSPPNFDNINNNNNNNSSRSTLNSSNDNNLFIQQQQQQQQLSPIVSSPNKLLSPRNNNNNQNNNNNNNVPINPMNPNTVSPRSMSTPNIHSIPLHSSPSLFATPRHNQREISLSPSHKLWTPSKQYFNRNPNTTTFSGLPPSLENTSTTSNTGNSIHTSPNIIKKQQQQTTRKGSLGNISFTSFKISLKDQQQQKDEETTITESEDDIEIEDIEEDIEFEEEEEYSDDSDKEISSKTKPPLNIQLDVVQQTTNLSSRSSSPNSISPKAMIGQQQQQLNISPLLESVQTTTTLPSSYNTHAPQIQHQHRTKSHSTLGIVTGPQSSSSSTTSTTSGFISPRRSSSQQPPWSKNESSTNILDMKKKGGSSSSSQLLEDNEDSVQLGSSGEFDEKTKNLKDTSTSTTNRPLVVHPIHPSSRNSDGSYKSHKHPLSRVSSAPVIQGPIFHTPQTSSPINTSPHTLKRGDVEPVVQVESEETKDQYYLIPKERYNEFMEIMNLPDIQLALKQRQMNSQPNPVSQQNPVPQQPLVSQLPPTLPVGTKPKISKSSNVNFGSLDLEFHSHRKKPSQDNLPTTTQQQQSTVENPIPTTQFKSQAHPLISRKSTSYLFEKTKPLQHLHDRSNLHLDLGLKSPLSSPSPSPREKLAEKELESINERKKERPSSIRKRQDPMLSPGSIISPSVTPRLGKNNTRLENPASPSSLSPEQRFHQQSPSPPAAATTQTATSPRGTKNFIDHLEQPPTPQQAPPYPRGIVRKLSTTAIHKLVNLPISSNTTSTTTSQSILLSPRKIQIQNILDDNQNNIAIHDIIEPSHANSLNILAATKQQQQQQKNDHFMISNLPFDNHFVGLSGIDIFDGSGSFIKLNELKTKIKTNVQNDDLGGGESPSLYGYDPKTIERTIDQVPRTCDDMHQWLAPFSKDQPITITILFDHPLIISLIRIWNYNKSRIYTYRGIKNIEIKLDNIIIFKGSIRKAQGTLHSCDECAEYLVFTNDETTLQSIEQNDPYSPSIYQQQLQQAELLEAFNNNNKSDNNNNNNNSTTFELEEKQSWTELQEHYSKVQLDKDGRPMTSALSFNPLMMKQILHTPLIISTTNQINNNSKSQNIQNLIYPKGKTLKFRFQSTWGDRFYLGLTGIEIFDHNYQLIRVGIKNINASPRDINQAGHTGDYRTLDKLVDGENITINDQHMWLIPFSSQPEDPTLTIDLGQIHSISCIRVYNYNKSHDDSSRGAKNVIISLDNINLSPDGFVFRKGPGTIDFDFGQIISFANFDKQKIIIDEIENRKENEILIPQDYKSPFLPSGFIFKMVILSTHGDKTKVGLNGIELYDYEGNLIKTNNNIVDLNDQYNPTIYRLLDGVNNSFDENHMWITNFNHPIYNSLNPNNNNGRSKSNPLNSICIYFDHPISLAMLKIWNFSKSTSRGVEDFELKIIK